MDKYFMWIHYERLHNQNKAKHNKTVCIFLGIYCSRYRESCIPCLQVWFNHCHTQNTHNGLLCGTSSQQHRTVLICIYQMLYVNCTAILWMIILGSLDPRTQVWEIQLIHHWLIKIIIGCELQRLVEWNDSSAFSNGSVKPISHTLVHYNDVIMITIGSQITSLTVVYSTVYSDADQRKHQSSASLAFVWGIHRDRWIPRTKGQLRRKCFHLMTSSWWVKYIKNFVPEACAKGRNYIPQILQDVITYPCFSDLLLV